MTHYYIVDTETTGTKDSYHEITQISIIRCSDKKQLNKFIKAEHPERTSEQALTYTGRTMADILKGGPKEDAVEICDKFFLEDGATPEQRCIVGHNIISFDKRFLHALWSSVGKEFPANIWLDTLPYIKAYSKQNNLNEKKFTLENALRIVGATPVAGEFHDAKIDTRNNFLLYEALTKSGVAPVPYMKRFAHEIGG